VAVSNDGWWVDENDNVYAPHERPTLVLDNGQTPPDAAFQQILWHQGNRNPVLEMNRKATIITLSKEDQWIGELLHGDK